MALTAPGCEPPVGGYGEGVVPVGGSATSISVASGGSGYQGHF